MIPTSIHATWPIYIVRVALGAVMMVGCRERSPLFEKRPDTPAPDSATAAAADSARAVLVMVIRAIAAGDTNQVIPLFPDPPHPDSTDMFDRSYSARTREISPLLMGGVVDTRILRSKGLDADAASASANIWVLPRRGSEKQTPVVINISAVILRRQGRWFVADFHTSARDSAEAARADLTK
jgi:hypothetical protein